MEENKENNNGESITKRCNVCLSTATKMCQGCQTRIYCGRGCQKADWDQHRLYCRPPPTRAERMDVITRDCEEFGIPFSRIEQMAENPNDIDSLEKAFESELARVVMIETGQDPKENKWPLLDESWQLNDEKVWEELRALPVIRNEEFSFSYMTAGIMDVDSGFLFWQLTVMSNSSGKIRYAANMTPKETTRPDRKELEQLIYLSMARPGPAAGSPGRPQYMLFAHRWGKLCTSALIDMLWNKLRIRARLESRADARISAAQHGTDPDGFNFTKNT